MSAEHGGESDEARRLYGLAAVAGTTEDHHKAQVALARLGGDIKSIEGRMRMLEAQLEESEDPEERLDLQRQLLELATASGDSAAALRHAELLLDSDRTDVSAFVALKSRAAESGDWQQVASLLSSRAAAVPDASEQAALYYELGRAYETDLGDLNAAVGAYEQALRADPRHPGALGALAEISYKKNDWLRAYQIYQRLSPETCSMPADVIALRQGEIAEALGREAEACDGFAEAVRLFPASRPALTALARTARRIGDLKRAIAATRALLELAPAGDLRATTGVRGELASLLAQSGDITGAIYYYELVVGEEPKAAGALAQLLDLYSEKGDYQGAARSLQALIALTGDADQRADLLYRLGELYRTQLDDLDLAADAYLKAVDLAPEHVPVLRRLLGYYFRVGDDKGMVEVGADLSRIGALADRDSGVDNLERLMLLAAVRNQWPMVGDIARWFGGETSERLVRAMLDCARVGRWDPESLSAAGAAVCSRLDLDGKRIYDRVAALATAGDPAAIIMREAFGH
jgi:tetratricopeptide (TPR) repeat protein